jgi:hypothetical protein
VRLCHPGQPHRQQRRQGEGKRHRQAGRSGPERPQRGVVGGFGKAQAGQHLPQDQRADGAEDPGEQPQGDRLQVDRMLGVRRRRGERDATRSLAVGEAGELAPHRRHVSGAVTEPQRGLGEGLGDFCPVRAPEGWGRPGMTRPGIDLGRELGGRGVDPGDPERERDWLAARLQHDPKSVSWSQMPATPQLSPQEDPCHGQRRTPVYLMRSGGIGKRPAALAGLGWPPMPAPMTTAFVLIFPISHPRIVMWGSPYCPGSTSAKR